MADLNPSKKRRVGDHDDAPMAKVKTIKSELAMWPEAGAGADATDDAGRCTICLDGGGEPPPIQRGCCCRGDGGLAHVACMVQLAAHTRAGRRLGRLELLRHVQAAVHGMQQGLAQAWWSRVASTDVDDPDRLAAADGLAGSYRA